MPDKNLIFQSADFSDIQFGAIFIFHDSRNWTCDLQITLDLLIAKNGAINTMKDIREPDEWTAENQIPIYSFADDLLFQNECPVQRLATGSFNEALKALYKKRSGYDLMMWAPTQIYFSNLVS